MLTTDQWTRLPVPGCVLVFRSNHSPGVHCLELGLWNTETDGRTDGRTHSSIASCPHTVGRGYKNPRLQVHYELVADHLCYVKRR